VVQGTEVDRWFRVTYVGRRVVREYPAINGGRKSIQSAAPVLASICATLPTQVVTHCPLADAEGLPDLGVGLPHELEGLHLLAECQKLCGHPPGPLARKMPFIYLEAVSNCRIGRLTPGFPWLFAQGRGV